MSQILFYRSLEKMPGNTREDIEKAVVDFGRYVRHFGNVDLNESQFQKDSIVLRMHIFYFLNQLFFYIFKTESINAMQIK